MKYDEPDIHIDEINPNDISLARKTIATRLERGWDLVTVIPRLYNDWYFWRRSHRHPAAVAEREAAMGSALRTPEPPARKEPVKEVPPVDPANQERPSV